MIRTARCEVVEVEAVAGRGWCGTHTHIPFLLGVAWHTQWNYKDTTVKTGKEMAEIFQDLLDKAGVFDVEEPEDDGTTAKIE